MRKIKLDDTRVFKGETAKSNTIRVWRRNFHNETSKFISASFLQPEDIDKEFIDKEGLQWKILGMMNNSREVPCENLQSGEIFTHERWEVSKFIHPDVHERMARKVETIHKSKPKKVKSERGTSKISNAKFLTEEEKAAGAQIHSAFYGSGEDLIDVSQKIIELYKIGEAIKIGNKLGGDPCPGVHKKIVIRIVLGEETIEKIYPEKTILEI